MAARQRSLRSTSESWFPVRVYTFTSIIDGKKKCNLCLAMKPTADFGALKRGRYVPPRCKDCRVLEVATWCKKNKKLASAIRRRTAMKGRYGISVETYEKMLSTQGGVCALCPSAYSHGKRLCVDHDHRTGRVRGLLCSRCNRLLGAVESAGCAKKIVRYLAGAFSEARKAGGFL